jgi:hypothetical protein
MRFPIEVADACCKIRDKYNIPEFISEYRLLPEKSFEDELQLITPFLKKKTS